MKIAFTCFYLLIAFSGLLIPSDLNPEIDFFSQKCEEGDFRICLRLGDMYFTGRGVSRNYIISQIIYEKAFSILKDKCNQNSDEHCIALGVFYEIGRGTERNINEAAYVFHDLCNKGICEGCDNLFRLKENLLINSESQYFVCSEKYYTF